MRAPIAPRRRRSSIAAQALFEWPRRALVTALVAGTAASCSDLPTELTPGARAFEHNLRIGAPGWEAGFANYRPDMGDDMELEAGHEPLPEALDEDGSMGLYIAGTNRSDDLFMFWKDRVDGLDPFTPYRVEFEVEFATEAPSGCVGNGGPPGESVYVKAGATLVEPEAVVGHEMGDEYYVMNIDKGNQAQEGADAKILGHVGNTASECTDWEWELKQLEGHSPIEIETDAEGAAWLIIGTDSGFEGRTRLYYTWLRVVFEPI